MIKYAYLIGRPSIPTHVAVGGLPVLLRQVLALQDAGIETVTLVGVSAASLRDERRVRIDLKERLQVENSWPPATVLVARAGCVWHPALIKRLARLPIPSAGMLAAGAGDRAIYVCDAQHVEAAVARLQANEPVAPEGMDPPRVELRRSEFAIVPLTEEDRRAATTLLLKSLEKPSDGLVSRHLHRPISRAVTRRLLPTSITPNAMTLIAAIFGIAAVPLALRGGYWNILLGAALFETQNILDGCDGEIARLTYMRSRGGEWLDQVLDDVLNIAFLAAVGTAVSSASAGWVWRLTLVCVAAQIVHVIGLYAGLIFKAGGRGSVATLRWRVDRPGAGRRMLGDLTRRDLYSLLYLVCAALNIVIVALLWHAVVTIGSAVVTTVQWIAWDGPEFYAGEGTTDPAGGAMA